jgi:hypothetical protein
MSYIAAQDRALRLTLMSNFLLAELLVSRVRQNYQLWLISPWITNFDLTLPRDGDVSALIDAAGMKPCLFDVLVQVARNGGQVSALVRTEYQRERIARFLTPLRALARDPHITLRQSDDLHAKIYVGYYGALHGSLNLTTSGVKHNLEFGAYASDARTIARLRNEARALFDAGEEVAL